MKSAHIISTTDPINGFNTNDPTIYFETEASRQVYLDIPVEYPERNLSKTLSNPTDDYSK